MQAVRMTVHPETKLASKLLKIAGGNGSNAPEANMKESQTARLRRPVGVRKYGMYEEKHQELGRPYLFPLQERPQAGRFSQPKEG